MIDFMKETLLFKDCKELIFLMLGKGNYNYGAQVKISKKLLSLYPDMSFWRNYDPQTYLSSLSVFLTIQGNEQIKKNYEMWQITKNQEKIKLSDKPVVDIVPVENKKNKTLAELIDDKL